MQANRHVGDSQASADAVQLSALAAATFPPPAQADLQAQLVGLGLQQASAEGDAAGLGSSHQPANGGGSQPTSQLPADQQQPAATTAGFQQLQLSETALDEVVHFQITNLGRQILVWAGLGSSSPALGNLAMGMVQPARAPLNSTSSPSIATANGKHADGVADESASVPAVEPAASRSSSVATVLLHGPGVDLSMALAKKLTARLGLPVIVAWTLPAGNPMLNAWAERRLTEVLTATQSP